MNKRTLPDGDDGRTIANMNVEGMPWYRPDLPDSIPQETTEEAGKHKDELTNRQVRLYTASALKAGLLVTLVMALGIVLFVAFCVFVWFR